MTRLFIACLLSATLASSVCAPVSFAAPKRSGKARPVSVAAKPPVPVDPQTLVSKGKRPAFFDPDDLTKSPVISAPAAILIDADTGQVLWEKNADVRRAPASTTKIMTALLFIENSKPDDIITCTDPKITKIEESSLHIKMWEKFTAQNLLYGFMLRSGNDGAVLIAQYIDGSVYKFAQRMNTRAQEIGATNTHFVNPHGLPAPAQFTTARDLALITREALKNPRFVDCVSEPSRTIERSKNKGDSKITMRVKKYFHDKFPGADGVKTGYTRAAGHCFVGSATRDGRRLLSVVLGSYDSASRDTIPLLSWGFKRFPNIVVAQANGNAGTIPLSGGQKSEVTVLAVTPVRASADSTQPTPLEEQVRRDARPLPGLIAPVRKGQVVGTLSAIVNGNVVSESNLIAAEDIEAAPVAAAVAQITHSTPLPWALPVLSVAGASLVAYKYATASAKSTRRRRNRVAAASRGTHRGGPG